MTAAAASQPSGTARAVFWGVLLLVGLGLLYWTALQGRGWWQDRALAQRGQVLSAQVVGGGQAPGPRSIGRQYGLTYRLPPGTDPAGGERHATVTEDIYRAAQASGQVAVRVLPGQPDVQQVVGAPGRGGSLFWLLVFDALYLAFAAALLRSGLSA